MAVYQCARCMKKFVDDRDITLLCPFCRCRVLPYHGAVPLNPCKVELLESRSPVLPLPMVERLSFVFIRLDKNNLDFWKNYVGAMRLIAMNSNFSEDLKYGWGQAVRGFLQAIDAYEGTPGSEVWIAAATFGCISKNNFAQSAVNIEMCMTVTTHPDVPFTTHMGIFRSPLRRLRVSSLERLRDQDMYRTNEIANLLLRNWPVLRSARNLSGQLHAFAAKRCVQESTGIEKVYMITCPLAKMMEIMEKNCNGFATKDVNTQKDDTNIYVIILGNRFTFKKSDFRKYIWLKTLADLNLDNGRPRIAIDIRRLAESMEEQTRVEAALDRLEKWA